MKLMVLKQVAYTDMLLAKCNNPRIYRTSGRLDLLDLVTPEGAPLNVESITFNKRGTRMYLMSRMTSISQPNLDFVLNYWRDGELLETLISGWLPGMQFG